MIVTKLQGGLGNQMFQYAIGKQIAMRNNTELVLDTTFYNYDRKRTYELHKFNVTDKVAQLNFSHNCNVITENSQCFNEQILNIKDNCYLSGFWQSEKYFKSIRQTILDTFTLKAYSDKFKEYDDMIKWNSVSIHIRRSDYVSEPHTNSFHGVCPTEYYQSAISYLDNLVDISKILIFSDDIQWAKDNLNLSAYGEQIVVEQLSNEEDMILMSKCSHNIIANSSFSWWGAWLNNVPDKIVIAPKNWFGPTGSHLNTNDIYCEKWIKI